MESVQMHTGILQRYFDRISQPLIDRMDLCVEAPMVTYEELTGNGNNESSKTIRDKGVRVSGTPDFPVQR